MGERRHEPEVVDTGDRLRVFHSGRLFVRRPSRIALLVLLLVMIAGSVPAGTWHLIWLPAGWFLMLVAWDRATVTAEGWRPNGTLRMRTWSEADGVVSPGRFDEDVQVRLTSGAETRTGIPVEYVDRVVELSGLPVVDRQAPPPRPQRHRPPREPSVAERSRKLREDLARLREDD